MSMKQVPQGCYTNEEREWPDLGWLVYRHITHANIMFNSFIFISHIITKWYRWDKWN